MRQSRRSLVLVAHNVRSAHNVGSLLRTAEGLGIEKIYLTGYSPYPEARNDSRLPHLRRRQAGQVHKTALGAEHSVNWQYEADLDECIKQLRSAGYGLLALEQTPRSVGLDAFRAPSKAALFVGNEVTGLEPAVLRKIKTHIQIPMSGRKESFNVAVAAAIALYHLSYIDKNAA